MEKKLSVKLYFVITLQKQVKSSNNKQTHINEMYNIFVILLSYYVTKTALHRIKIRVIYYYENSFNTSKRIIKHIRLPEVFAIYQTFTNCGSEVRCSNSQVVTQWLNTNRGRRNLSRMHRNKCTFSDSSSHVFQLNLLNTFD